MKRQKRRQPIDFTAGYTQVDKNVYLHRHAVGDMSRIWGKRRFCAAPRSLPRMVRGAARWLAARKGEVTMERRAKTKKDRTERPMRSLNVTTRVSPEERALVEEQAAQAGMSVSEWARQVVLEAAMGIPLTTRFLAEEIIAVRALLVGMQPGQKPYTVNQIDESKRATAAHAWKLFQRRREAGDGQ